MAQIKSDHFSGDIRFQQSHGGRVPKRVRGDGLLLELGGLSRGAGHQVPELIGRARATELLAEAIG